MKKKILITGSSGLIGSEVAKFFDAKNWDVHGLDNNQREVFFGTNGSTLWNLKHLQQTLKSFTHHELDIRHREAIIKLVNDLKPDAIVHTAAQPSHDLAAKIPFDDFDTNAVGTFNLLEATRQCSCNIPFVFLSTNKVYGDAPNYLNLIENETRWDYQDPQYFNGINEKFQIDQCKHSLFGASKLAADISVQEYGQYFNMPTVCLRGGCLTGPSHSGVELHGFLSYIIKCNLEHIKYTIFGYKGKQVRDNIHSYDVSNFIYQFISNPKSGQVYNIGGGKDNSCSILEVITIIQNMTHIKMNFEYNETNRIGDHICYYTDLTKIKNDYTNWDITISLEETINQIIEAWQQRIKK